MVPPTVHRQADVEVRSRGRRSVIWAGLSDFPQ